MNWIEIAVIKCRLKYLDRWNKKRRKIAKIYTENFKDLPLILQKNNNKAHHIYREIVIRTESRDKLQKFLSKKGIETVIY